MSENFTSVLTDVAKQIAHEKTDDLVKALLVKWLPQSTKEWLSTHTGWRMPASALSVGISQIARKIKSPVWEIADTFINALVAEMKDYFAEYTPEEMAQAKLGDMPLSMQEKVGVISHAAKLGTFSLPAKTAKKITSWIRGLQDDGEHVLAHKAVIITSRMSTKELRSFAEQSFKDKTAYIRAVAYEEPVPIPPLAFTAEEPQSAGQIPFSSLIHEEQGFVESWRGRMDKSIEKMKAERPKRELKVLDSKLRLAEAKIEGKARLRKLFGL